MDWDWIIIGLSSTRIPPDRRTATAEGPKTNAADKRSRQTHALAKTSRVWTPASSEEWGKIDSPSASLWGQQAHPAVSLQGTHRHTQAPTLQKWSGLSNVFLFFCFIFIYNSAKPGLLKDMFNKVALVSWQIFSALVLEVALVPVYEGLCSEVISEQTAPLWDSVWSLNGPADNIQKFSWIQHWSISEVHSSQM